MGPNPCILCHHRVPVLLEQHLGDHREPLSSSAVFPAQLAFMGLPFLALTLQVSPCTSQLLHNFLEETSGPGQSHFPFKMHSAPGAAVSLEQKEHLCELLFFTSFCLFLLKLFAGISAGPWALFIDSSATLSKSSTTVLVFAAHSPREQVLGGK